MREHGHQRRRAARGFHHRRHGHAPGFRGSGHLAQGQARAFSRRRRRGPRHRLWKIRARRIITATGAIERPLSFAGNDLPGVMLASAVRDYLVNFAVSPGKRTVIVTNNDDAYRSAIALVTAGQDVRVIVDARIKVDGQLTEKAQELGIAISISKIGGVSQVKILVRLNGEQNLVDEFINWVKSGRNVDEEEGWEDEDFE